MKEIAYEAIAERIAEAVIRLNCVPDQALMEKYDKAIQNEENDRSREVLSILRENAVIAGDRMMPICQDTGTLVVFLRLGDQVRITGGSLMNAIYQGVASGYQKGFLRKSIVDHPFRRKNTGTNLPPVIHTELAAGEELQMVLMAKGAGSENMSAIAMMAPSQGKEGVKAFVLETVRKAGPNPCPPVLVGVGIGGNFEGSALLAKKALAKELFWDIPEDPEISELETELTDSLNQLNIGPQGFGGKVTTFGVQILTGPCHIASMPVAVNINCHVLRHMRLDF